MTTKVAQQKICWLLECLHVYVYLDTALPGDVERAFFDQFQ